MPKLLAESTELFDAARLRLRNSLKGDRDLAELKNSIQEYEGSCGLLAPDQALWSIMDRLTVFVSWANGRRSAPELREVSRLLSHLSHEFGNLSGRFGGDLVSRVGLALDCGVEFINSNDRKLKTIASKLLEISEEYTIFQAIAHYFLSVSSDLLTEKQDHAFKAFQAFAKGYWDIEEVRKSPLLFWEARVLLHAEKTVQAEEQYLEVQYLFKYFTETYKEEKFILNY